MLAIVSALLRCLFSWLRPKHELALENLALRHQIAVLHRGVHKPRLQGKDRLFWVVLKRWWPNWVWRLRPPRSGSTAPNPDADRHKVGGPFSGTTRGRSLPWISSWSQRR